MDELDCKLIIELEKDGRRSSAQIAEDLNTTKATIARRINSLLDSGYINIRAKPDLLRLGWNTHALVLVRANYKQVEAVLDVIANVIYVTHLGTHFNHYNIYFLIDTPDSEELHSIIKQIKALPGVNAVKPYFIEKFNKRPIYQDNPFYLNQLTDTESINLEKGDLDIMNKLIEDGRQTYIQLAESLDRPASVVRRRVQWLIEQNVFRIAAIPSPIWLGFAAQAIVLLRFHKNNAHQAINQLCQDFNVIMLATVTNNADAAFIIQAEKLAQLQEKMMSVIEDIDGMEIIDIMIRSGLKKQYYTRSVLEELHMLSK